MTRPKSLSLPWLTLVLGTGLLLTLAGCADAPVWGGWSAQPTVAQVQKGRGIQADWVYYPAYQIYYSRHYQQYVFFEMGDWVTRLEPAAPVTVEELLASPSVGMNFEDAPGAHHAEVVQRYPRDWHANGSGFVSVLGS